MFIWKPQGAINSIGYLIAIIYSIWNIYAYTNTKTMYPPLKNGIDYSTNGSKDARTFLLIISFLLYVFSTAIWITKGISISQAT